MNIMMTGQAQTQHKCISCVECYICDEAGVCMCKMFEIVPILRIEFTAHHHYIMMRRLVGDRMSANKDTKVGLSVLLRGGVQVRAPEKTWQR